MRRRPCSRARTSPPSGERSAAVRVLARDRFVPPSLPGRSSSPGKTIGVARHTSCSFPGVDLRDRSSSVPPVLLRAPLWDDDDTSPTEVFVRLEPLVPSAPRATSPVCPREGSPRPVRGGPLGRGLTFGSLVLVGFVSGHGAVRSWRHAKVTTTAPPLLSAAVQPSALSRTDMSVVPRVEPVPRVEVRPPLAASVAPIAVPRPSSMPQPNAPVVMLARPPRGALPAVKPPRRPKVDAPPSAPPRSSGDESRSRAIATARSALDGAL